MAWTWGGSPVGIASSSLEGEYLEQTIGDYLWFQKWGRGTRPKVLTPEDLDDVLASGRLFARKFDISVDGGALLDRLDAARATG